MDPREEQTARQESAAKAQQDLDRIFHGIFQGHPDGQRIWLDLQYKFHDRTSVTNPVDANATLVLEGQRQVVLYIMSRISRCAEGQK